MFTTYITNSQSMIFYTATLECEAKRNRGRPRNNGWSSGLAMMNLPFGLNKMENDDR